MASQQDVEEEVGARKVLLMSRWSVSVGGDLRDRWKQGPRTPRGGGRDVVVLDVEVVDFDTA